jgi:hypothetical protein
LSAAPGAGTRTRRGLSGLTAACLAVLGAASPRPLAAAEIGAAARAQTIAKTLPRAWCGRYRWRGDTTIQRFAIAFSSVTVGADGRVTARGAAVIIVPGRRYALTVSAVIEPRTRHIELREHRAIPDTPDFTTDGAHRGTLGPHLRTIRTVWTQNRTGERGDLRLHAVPAESAKPPACADPGV